MVRSPVGALADEAGIAVLTPRRLSEPGFLDTLRDSRRTAARSSPTARWCRGRRWTCPRTGWVNLHFSLLPAWRGAAPVQAALRHGDEITGAATFRLEEGLDTGPVYGVVTEAVAHHGHRGRPAGPPVDSGAALLAATVDGIADGTVVARPQPAEGVSHAPKVTVDDARVDWAEPALAVDRLVRAVTPEPGAWTTFRGERLGLGPVRPADAPAPPSSSPASCTPRSDGCSSAPRRRRWSWARSARSGARHARGRLGARRAHRARRGARDDRATRPAPPRRPDARAGPSGGPRGAGPPRGRTGPARPPELDPARMAALELLTAVRVRNAYANLACPAILRRHGLRDRDAALATELGYGTLRARGLLDAVIEACTERPLHRIEPAAARRPAPGRLPAAAHPGAAARRGRHHRRAGPGGRGHPGRRFRQRRAAPGRRARRGGLGGAARARPEEDPVGHAALAHAHPRWIARAFADALGAARGRARRRARRRRRPPVGAPAGPARRDHRRGAGPGHGRRAGAVLALRRAPRAGHRRHRGARRRRARGSRGAGRGQPAGGAGADPRAGRRRRTPAWLDLCAGPGGKSALLGALVALEGGTLDAVEPAEHRAELVRRAVDGPPVTVHIADGRDGPAARRRLRPGAGRRPVHRSGRAAAAARGALAAPAGGRGRR